MSKTDIGYLIRNARQIAVFLASLQLLHDSITECTLFAFGKRTINYLFILETIFVNNKVSKDNYLDNHLMATKSYTKVLSFL